MMSAASPATLPIPTASSAPRRPLSRPSASVHVVCNNAGVAAAGGIDHISVDNWRWVVDVNLMGVVSWHPLLPAAYPQPRRRRPHRQHRLDGRDGQRASGSAPTPRPSSRWSRMSEGLAHADCKPLGIGVSVLCPDFVRTRIGESGRNRPERYGPAQPLDPASPAAAMVAEIARQICGRASTPPTSRRACSPRSARTSSTCSPIRTCAPGWMSASPRSRRRWTRRLPQVRQKSPGLGLYCAVPRRKTTLEGPAGHRVDRQRLPGHAFT